MYMKNDFNPLVFMFTYFVLLLLLFWAMLHGLQDLISHTKEQTQALGSKGAES